MTVTGHLSQLKYKNVSEICLCVKSIFIFDADQERKILFLSAELWGFCKGQILPRLFFIFSNGLDRYKLLKIFYRVILMLIASFAKNFLDRHAAESFPLWVGVAGPRVLQKHLLGSDVHGAKLGTDPATGTANVDRNLLVVYGLKLFLVPYSAR